MFILLEQLKLKIILGTKLKQYFTPKSLCFSLKQSNNLIRNNEANFLLEQQQKS